MRLRGIVPKSDQVRLSSQYILRKMDGMLAPIIFYFRSLQWKWFRGRRKPIFQFRRRGIRWNAFRHDDYVSRVLFTYGSWQFNQVDAALEWLAKRMPHLGSEHVLVNIGAYIGSTAIRMATRSPCKILAIEPVSDFIQLLSTNVQDNRLGSRICCHKSAVLDHAAEVTMRIPWVNPGSAEIATAQPNGALHYPIYKEVPAQGERLDQILKYQRINPASIALVWADMQGCEGHALRSGEVLWKAGVPLVIEFWPAGISNQERVSIVPLIQRYFRSFSILPSDWRTRSIERQSPIALLNDQIVGHGSEIDLLLIP